jgi:hypothetical protein
MKEAARDADRAARDIGRDFGRVEREMGDIGKESASEFKQNLSETLSSGGGIEDVVQDTLGGLVSGLEGTLGTVLAGLAGLAALAFSKAREQAAIEAQALADLGDSIITHMQELRSGILTNRDAADLLAESVAQNTDQWHTIADLAKTAGVNWVDMAQDVIEGGSSAEDVYQRLYDIIAEGTTTGARGVQDRSDEANAALALLGHLKDVQGVVQDSASDWRLMEDALRGTAGYSDTVARNLAAARDASRGLRGEMPYYGGNRPQ